MKYKTNYAKHFLSTIKTKNKAGNLTQKSNANALDTTPKTNSDSQFPAYTDSVLENGKNNKNISTIQIERQCIIDTLPFPLVIIILKFTN